MDTKAYERRYQHLDDAQQIVRSLERAQKTGAIAETTRQQALAVLAEQPDNASAQLRLQHAEQEVLRYLSLVTALKEELSKLDGTAQETVTKAMMRITVVPASKPVLLGAEYLDAEPIHMEKRTGRENI